MIFIQLINIFNYKIVNDQFSGRDIYDYVHASTKFCLYLNNSLASWAPKIITFKLNEFGLPTIQYYIYLLWTKAFTLYIIATFFILFFLFLYLFFLLFVGYYLQMILDKTRQFMFFDYNYCITPTIDLVYIEYYLLIMVIIIIVIVIHGFLGYINIYTDYVHTNDSGFLTFFKYILLILFIIIVIYIYMCYNCGAYYFIV